MKKAPKHLTIVMFKEQRSSNYGYEDDTKPLQDPYYFHGEIPNARGHCILQSASTGEFLTMVHMSDLRKATEDEW